MELKPMYNPDLNFPEFEGFKNEAGLNRFMLCYEVTNV